MKKENMAATEAERIVEDAQALLAATAHIADETVVAARKRLATALDEGKDLLERVREKAIEGAKAADETVREHPYHAIGLALGAGALLGFLVGRRH